MMPVERVHLQTDAMLAEFNFLLKHDESRVSHVEQAPIVAKAERRLSTHSALVQTLRNDCPILRCDNYEA